MSKSADAQEKYEFFLSKATGTADIIAKGKLYGGVGNRRAPSKVAWRPHGRKRRLAVTNKLEYQGNGVWDKPNRRAPKIEETLEEKLTRLLAEHEALKG
jgi:hypothetical protein